MIGWKMMSVKDVEGKLVGPHHRGVVRGDLTRVTAHLYPLQEK